MKCYALVTPSMEKVAHQEIQELISVSGEIMPSLIEFDAKTKEDVLTVLYHAQSIRRLLLALGKGKDPPTMTFLPLVEDIFTPTATCKIDVEYVKGQDNLLALDKTLGQNLFAHLSQQYNLSPSFDLKQPTHHIIMVYTPTEYVVGVDVAGKELNIRDYRVFPHAASWKGDLAYYFLRQSHFDPEKRSLFFFVKDGALPIEAALFAVRKSIQDPNAPFAWRNFPLFRGINREKSTTSLSIKLSAGDESMPNIIAARKNAKLAGIEEYLTINKYALDELDVKFTVQELEYVCFFLTTKDEDKLNELYYQASYILAPTGILFLITRKGFDLSIPSQFILEQRTEFQKGDSVYITWLMRKK
ncbi:MAG: hypothetical protein AABX37_05545 [Nanoarchaeota archaeon]